jgi:transcription-repair coupling factor (superfamily II helicase)
METLPNKNVKSFLKGLTGSSLSLFFAAFFFRTKKTSVLIFSEKEDASYIFDDICRLIGDDKVIFFPSSFKQSAGSSIVTKMEASNIILRTEALNKIFTQESLVIVTYTEAIFEKVISRKKLEENTLRLHTGEKVSIKFICEVLDDYHFQRVDFAFEPGQFSVRGSIIDIFSFSNDDPYRIDFFGEEVESIRTFDLYSQLSKTKLESITIIPNIENKILDSERISFFDYIPKTTFIWIKDFKFIHEKFKLLTQQITNATISLSLQSPDEAALHHEQFIDEKIFAKNLENFTLFEVSHHIFFKPDHIYDFDISPQPSFNKNFDLLGQNLTQKAENGYINLILSENQKQINRLNSIFESDQFRNKVKFTPILSILHEGFIDNDSLVCVYTDHQIFQRYHKYQLKTDKINSGKEAISLQELLGLQPGDYVVHVDHGIGVFGGLTKIEVNGKMQEAIRLSYKDSDTLFVSIHSLHRISKYRGKDGIPPTVHKLGSGIWQRLKNKTKSKVKDIAKELIVLYAKRKLEQGFQFSPDSFMQDELESSFIYEDTPDQLKATQAVKKDMESISPMDRLICGDVGFGKTEVAIRAAFKAVADNKQVAVLVPTTILALQHYSTFKERLKEFPCNVDYISRLKSTKDQKISIEKLADGKTDIIIGTHRIIGSDIKFKDLGLLVIDEEQKFGVAVKEKLKRIKLNVDTLTLTATPIPRTLQFSLMGARDLSIINTPPPNRYPIITELHPFNEDIIRDAINYELNRNGQIFFINNRIQNIYDLEVLLRRICPGVKTGVAHGQLEGTKLEQVMLDFINHEFDVLLATTIVESGLDIPNANTIIINDAQNFGLSDLHQLRGRVGRSNKKAFAYLLSPPMSVLTPEARRRLQAIENFSELGSGFNIALQDLDIRGAGNLLGGEQSGFIADIGFETYQKILDEALLELKETDFKDYFKENQDVPTFLKDTRFINDCHIETDLQLLFPEEFVSNVSERIRLYRELDNIGTEEKLQEFEKNILDRFGKLPEKSKDLLNVVRLRWIAERLGIEKIILKNKLMICYFLQNKEAKFYDSQVWRSIIAYIQKNPKHVSFKEAKDRLNLTIQHIRDIYSAIKVLEKIEVFSKTNG